jgi:hypothetical protein
MTDCGQSCESFAGSSTSAEDAADVLATYVDPDRLDSLAATVQETADSRPAGRQVFWSEVLTILGYE